MMHGSLGANYPATLAEQTTRVENNVLSLAVSQRPFRADDIVGLFEIHLQLIQTPNTTSEWIPRVQHGTGK